MDNIGYTGREIAIIGIDGQFPKCKNVSHFWSNINKGKELTTTFCKSDLDQVEDRILNDPNFVFTKGYLENVELFDASFFCYSSKEAKLMDPQLKLLHESCVKALEDSGYFSSDPGISIGVFLGASHNIDWELLTKVSGEREGVMNLAADSLVQKDFIATQISYNLNLSGPSVTLQTACSTSLVAVNQAVKSILLGECKLALTGGACVTLPLKDGYMYREGMIMSKDGHCRAFSDDANGTIPGNGCGVVVLKRLKEAIADRDNIYAIIKGTAVNNDGSRKVAMSAPSIDGQKEVIRKALQFAKVDSESITYVETHGTGTALGDPVEFEGLRLAFNTEKKNYCALGSLKSNIGHLDAAAGVAGLIKATLAIKHRQIPPMINFNGPNPKLRLEESPFYIPTELKEWKNDKYPLRAGVSSFGIGGTNAHVILEEAPEILSTPSKRPYQLLCFSTKSIYSLEQIIKQYICYLADSKSFLEDISYTLHVGRKEFGYRVSIVCCNTVEAKELLEAQISLNLLTGKVPAFENRRIIFMFTGQGSQYTGMSKDLYKNDPVFKDSMDICMQLYKRISGIELHDVLYADQKEGGDQEISINNTCYTQPILFMLEYSLSKLLNHYGIFPLAMIGHSIGEYVAGCVSGVFTLEEAIELVYWRGKLMSEMKPGTMLSVHASRADLSEEILQRVDIAAVNTPQQIVLSGSYVAVSKVRERLEAQQIYYVPLQTSHAFHSSMMEPMLERYREVLQKVDFKAPQIPYVSNVTGNWITAEEAMSADYWLRQLREKVRFSEGLASITSDNEAYMFIEVGPGNVLGNMVQEQSIQGAEIFSILRHPKESHPDDRYFLQKLGEMWEQGLEVNWQKLYEGEQRKRISLPTYVFDKKKHWIEGNPYQLINEKLDIDNQENDKKKPIDEWLYVPLWYEKPLQVDEPNNDHESVIVFGSKLGLASNFISSFNDQTVIKISPNEKYLETDSTTYSINYFKEEHFTSLFNAILQNGELPKKIICFIDDKLELSSDENVSTIYYFGLIYLCRNLRKISAIVPYEIVLINTDTFNISGQEETIAYKKCILSIQKVIPQEFGNIKVSYIDLCAKELDIQYQEDILSRIKKEIISNNNDNIVAYRNFRRWCLNYSKIRLPKVNSSPYMPRKRNNYIITGGTGKIGLVLMVHLVKKYNSKVILTGRNALSDIEFERKCFDDVKDRLLIDKIKSNVKYLQADVCDHHQMSLLFERVEKNYGPVTGLFHCAGIDTKISIEEISLSNSNDIFNPKIKGINIIKSIVDKKDIDFVVIMSSLASVLGGLGYVPYSAANLYIDAIAEKQTDNKTKWLSINWDGWSFNQGSTNNKQIFNAISPEEGLKVLERLMSQSEYKNIIVSTSDLNYRISNWLEQGVKSSSASVDEEKLFAEKHISLADIGEIVRNIWNKFIHSSTLQADSNFFAIGGDSLKVLSVVSNINNRLKTNISISDFYNNQTLSELVQFIKNKKSNSNLVKPAEKKEYYNLSSTQKRLYVLQLLNEDSIGYNETQAYKIEGDLDIKKLELAFESLIVRHEILRTSIILIDEKPYQYINNEFDFKLEILQKTEDNIESVIQSFKRPFNMGTVPFWRVGLFHTSSANWLLIIDIHHIITDAVSHDIIFNELQKIYNGLTLEKVNISYKDYAEWQMNYIKGNLFVEHEKYWVSKLEGNYESIKLPYDYVKSNEKNYDGNSISITLSEEIVDKLKTISLNHESTLFITIYSLFKIFLFKITGQRNIIVGTPVHGRKSEELLNVPGAFINMMCLLNDININESYQGYLKKLKDEVFKSFGNQDYPFEFLVDKIDKDRNSSNNPLYDVLFVFQNINDRSNFETAQENTNSMQVSTLNLNRTSSKVDLSLIGFEESGKLRLIFEYCTSLFKEETIRRFINYFQFIIKQVVEDPSISINSIQVLPEEELIYQHTVLNNTIKEYPLNKRITDYLQGQVQCVPTSPCLQFGEKVLNYKEFDTQSNIVANKLIEYGIGRNCIVGIYADRSLEMLIGIWGIVKAGAAYLPLSPEHPRERIIYQIKDSNVKLLLTDKALLSADFGEGIELLSLDRMLITSDISYSHPVEPFARSEDDICYVIYTSGSTGQPKGTLISHQALINRLHWMQSHYCLSSSECLLQKTPFTFDVSVWELFWWSMTGSRLVILEPGGERNPELLNQVIREQKVSIVHFVPSMLELYLDFLQKEGALLRENSLRLVICSGEALTVGQVQKFKEILRASHLVSMANLYGPTEATIDVSYHDIDFEKDYSAIPIGRPIYNTGLYVCAKYFDVLQPLGIEGELHIVGDGVSAGYLNKPELTAEKFGYNASLGKRSYRTGDMAKWTDKGEIEYLGRIDNQVKIRGNRIELGEIENCLQTIPEIKSSVVLCREDKDKDKYLSAYLVFWPGQELKIEAVHEQLQKQLPAYMIPTKFYNVELIPLSHNGKIDRKKLIEKENNEILTQKEYVAPKTNKDKVIIDVIQDVLGKLQISLQDNFFYLGGDSIKAIQIAAKLRSKGYRLKMNQLFLTPVISELINFVELDSLNINQEKVEGNFELSPIQRKFFNLKFVDQHHYNQSILLHVKNRFFLEDLRMMFDVILGHHDILRANYIFDEQSNKYIGRINKDITVDYLIEESLDSTVDLSMRVTQIHRSLRLENGTLMKVGLFHLPDSDRILIICHHLNIDGVSWRILLEDFNTLYGQILANEDLKLPLKTSSFKDWTEKLIDSKSKYSDELEFWQKIEKSDLYKIPLDFLNNDGCYKNQSSEIAKLSEEATDFLLNKANHAYNTEINDLLLTALGRAIYSVYGMQKIPVVLEGHGREDIFDNIDITRTLGWFTIEYPILLGSLNESDYGKNIKNTKETLRLIPNKGIGYGINKMYLDCNSEVLPESKYQIRFNYLGQFDEDVNNTTIEIASEGSGEGVSLNNRREYELDITGRIYNKVLSISCYYDREQFNGHTISSLVSQIINELHNIVVHCSDQNTTEYTVSDFDYKDLSEEELNDIF